MSGSNQGAISNAELKRYVKLAAIVAALILTYGIIQHTIYYHQATSNAEYYSKNAKKQLSFDCTRIERIEPSDCSRKINNTARQQQRDEYDLYSQQAMALWTSVMGGMAIVGVFLTALGVWFVKRTLDATLEAVDRTGDATDAVLKSNEIAKKFSRQQLQANISLSDVTHNTKLNKKVYVKLRVTNDGQTPALNFRGAAQVTIRKTDDFPATKNVDFTKYPPNIVGAGGDSNFHGRIDQQILPEIMVGLESGEYSIFCDGQISYEDIFQNQFIVSFQMISDNPVKQGTFSPVGDGICIEKVKKQNEN